MCQFVADGLTAYWGTRNSGASGITRPQRAAQSTVMHKASECPTVILLKTGAVKNLRIFLDVGDPSNEDPVMTDCMRSGQWHPGAASRCSGEGFRTRGARSGPRAGGGPNSDDAAERKGNSRFCPYGCG